jgi:hypothetical protein
MPKIEDQITQPILKGFWGGQVFLENLYCRNFHTDKRKEVGFSIHQRANLIKF